MSQKMKKISLRNEENTKTERKAESEKRIEKSKSEKQKKTQVHKMRAKLRENMKPERGEKKGPS